MQEYKIELLIKVNNKEYTLFNNEEKLVEFFKLNDKLTINKIENNQYYDFVFRNKKFKFFISMEAENIYSVAIQTIADLEGNPDILGVLDVLSEAVRELKVIVSSDLANCSYEVLWDDVGIYYSQKAFPEIIRIENLMRKLITKFMLVSVGMDFFNNIPNGITPRNDKDTDSGFLHNIDFSDLAKYLFDARPLKNYDELIKIIDALQENVLPLDVNLLNYKKDSYWNRYFKDIVGNDIEASLIKADWEHLYKLRCKIAHSKFLNKDEWKQIHALCQKLNKTFSDALAKLNDIHLSEANKQTISEDIFSEIEGTVWYKNLYELIIRNFNDEFSLNDLYVFEPLLQEQYPENHTIKASIRRNLQKLRNYGKIEFISNGKYKIIKEK